MKARLVRGSVVVLLVLAMAVTPLSVVFSAGRFETWLSTSLPLRDSHNHVTLSDETGMVREISAAVRTTDSRDDVGTVVNPAGNRSVLLVTWGDGSCARETQLGFRPSGHGYELEQRTLAYGCGFLDLRDFSVAIYLWSPIDAADVAVSQR
jgi:hypothetical protein